MLFHNYLWSVSYNVRYSLSFPSENSSHICTGKVWLWNWPHTTTSSTLPSAIPHFTHSILPNASMECHQFGICYSPSICDQFQIMSEILWVSLQRILATFVLGKFDCVRDPTPPPSPPCLQWSPISYTHYCQMPQWNVINFGYVIPQLYVISLI